MSETQLKNIPINQIDDFPNHPFKVRDDEDMEKLIESIAERGVLVPAIVRPKADGRYELVSGHRRKYASEKLCKDNLYCVVSNLSDDDAIIVMVDSNIQRTNILPSEKAFAYKMRLAAMNRQGQRTDLTSCPLGRKLNTAAEIAENTGDSERQIYRYIRLTNLVPELLEFVDESKIKLRPAVELSYLDEDCQRDLVDFIDDNECTPSHYQAIQMHKLFDKGKLTTDVIYSIMEEEKPNQKEKITLSKERVDSLIPKSVPPKETEEYILKALEHYKKYIRSRKKEAER